MKTLFLFILILISLHVQSQVSFAGKPSGSTITLYEFLNEKELKLNPNEGTIVRFTVSVMLKDGNIYEGISASSHISLSQELLFKKLESQGKIYIEDIFVKLLNDSVVKYPPYFLIKDGSNANLQKQDIYEDNKKAAYLYHHPRIYGYPDYHSFDTTQYQIVSFKIKSAQPNYYYEFVSSNNMLTPEMLNFIKKATVDFSICDIKAIDKNNQAIDLNSILIQPFEHPNMINRSKNQLLNAKKIDFISPSANIKIKSFKLEISDVPDKEQSISSKNDEITTEMKNYIQKSSVGNLLFFSVDCSNSKGEEQTISLDVKIVD